MDGKNSERIARGKGTIIAVISLKLTKIVGPYTSDAFDVSSQLTKVKKIWGKRPALPDFSGGKKPEKKPTGSKKSHFPKKHITFQDQNAHLNLRNHFSRGILGEEFKNRIQFWIWALYEVLEAILGPK